MTLEDTLRAGIERSRLRHLLLVKDGRGNWQASTNREGQGNGFTVIVHPDPIKAIEQSITVGHYRDFPEFVGTGSNGPGKPEWKALDAALTRALTVKGW